MTTLASAMEVVSELVLPNGQLRGSLSELEDKLRQHGLLDLWNDVERIVTSDLGDVAAYNYDEFQEKRNALFLRVVGEGLDIGPMLAVRDLDATK